MIMAYRCVKYTSARDCHGRDEECRYVWILCYSRISDFDHLGKLCQLEREVQPGGRNVESLDLQPGGDALTRNIQDGHSATGVGLKIWTAPT